MPYHNLELALSSLDLSWSDHAYQSIIIDVMDPQNHAPIYAISTGTWNLQDCCHSKAKHKSQAFHNNPFDYDEPEDTFYKRKIAQILKLEIKIRAGDDIIFLQEVDFLTSAGIARNPGIFEFFCDMLRRNDYALVIGQSRPPRDVRFQQPLATIYNRKRLALLQYDTDHDFRSVFKSDKYQFRGMETAFRILDLGPLHGKTLMATNLHLKFGVDYRKDIEDYQQYMEGLDVLHVMGGDTNNVQNQGIINAIGDQSFATNFTSTEETPPRLTIAHPTGVNKAYDNFFIVPFNQYYITAKFCPQRSEIVEIDERGYAVFRPNLSTYVATSSVGVRWRSTSTGQVLISAHPASVFAKPMIASSSAPMPQAPFVATPIIVPPIAPIPQAPFVATPITVPPIASIPQAPVVISPMSLSPQGLPLPHKTQKQIDAEVHFNTLLQEILSKRADFEKNGFTDAALAAGALHTELSAVGKSYFTPTVPNKCDYQHFAQICSQEIEKARGILQHHRGWKDFIAKTALTLICVIIPLALAMVSRYNTGNWNFRLFDTDSSKKLDALQKSVNDMSPSP
jgi:hypothetical protein